MGALGGLFAIVLLFLNNLVGPMPRIVMATGLLSLFLAWPTWKLRRDCRRFAREDRVLMFGWRYGLGVAVALYVPLPFVIVAADEVDGMALIGFMGFAILLLIALAVVATIALQAYWRLLRLTLPTFVKQDGSLCPQCAYRLIGIESMRCPECGTAFTYEDLETTEAAFRALADGP